MTRKGGSSTSRPPDLEARVPDPEGGALLGSTLRRLRKEKKLDLEAVASLAGIPASDLARVERGTHRIGLDVLVRILTALGAGKELSESVRDLRAERADGASGDSPGSSAAESLDPEPFPRRTRSAGLREPLSLL